MTELLDDWRLDALTWAGRKVRIVDGPSADKGTVEIGTVICVDATDYRPSAWVKINGLERSERRPTYPSYRSCDLCWLEDADTADGGPVWCSPPGADGHGELDATVIAERVRSIASADTHRNGQDAEERLGS